MVKNINKIKTQPKENKNDECDKDYVSKVELDLLLDTLPHNISDAVRVQGTDGLIEIVLDLGRSPEARYFDGRRVEIKHDSVIQGDINYVVSRIGDFTSDNRAGIARTLHRISAIRNRKGDVIGLTCRIGKSVSGTIDSIRDLVESKKSILLLGPPGVGKTTRLREIARVTSDELNRRVIVIDTSNEIAGDGDIAHEGIGKARRMQVTSPELQHKIMIEAVENHTPEVIVIDEIGTELEAQAARTIAERGVQLIATAHGIELTNLLKNPVLSDLVGGIQTVTLGDEEAKRRGTQKTILERAQEPTFDVAIEIINHSELAVHTDVALAVDELLRGRKVEPEIRKHDKKSGKVEIIEPKEVLQSTNSISVSNSSTIKTISIYPYAVSRGQLERSIRILDLPATLSRTIDEADVIFALKTYAKQGAKILDLSKKHKIPLYVVKNNSVEGMNEVLRLLFPELISDFVGEKVTNEFMKEKAIEEVKNSINKIMETDTFIDLTPQNSVIRNIQHDLANSYKLKSLSIGQEPNRRVRIFPPPKPGEG